MVGEGYLILASGPPQYLAMARNLAASIRVMDGTRPICIVHDEFAEFIERDKALFDDRAILRDHPLYPGFMNKIRLFEASPYQRTMFVDADCLMLKRDIDVYWEDARPFPFAITGGRRTSGEWKGADIATLLRQEGAPYLVQMNSGVFCFDRTPQAAEFFEGLNDFYLRRRDKLGVGLHRGKPAQTDEIYIGLWMGLNGLDSSGGQADGNSWMVSTWRAFWPDLDPEHGVSTLYKPRHSLGGIPNPLTGWEKLSPTFVHFIKLQPRRQYLQLSKYFQEKALSS